MARTHAHTHGKSHSIRPISKNVPTWLDKDQDKATELVLKLAKEGLTPSQIGLKLRDEFGIPLVKPVTGKTMKQILEENGIKQEMPEELDQLVKKALGLQKHLRTHNSDHRNVRSLELIEAKIHRISKYYKNTGRLQKKWKYAAVIAQLE